MVRTARKNEKKWEEEFFLCFLPTFFSSEEPARRPDKIADSLEFLRSPWMTRSIYPCVLYSWTNRFLYVFIIRNGFSARNTATLVIILNFYERYVLRGQRTFGSLRKPRRQRERHRTKDLRSEQWLCTCVINLGTFLCRPLQNNRVKWPNSALSGEREPQRLIFEIFIWDLSLCFRFTFVIPLTVINKVNDFRVSRDS